MRAGLLILAGLSACACMGGAALAQQAIDPAHSFGWGENCGWVNFGGDAPAGVHVHGPYLSGYAWSENFGWIHMGNTPADGVHHANTDDTDYGVNVAASGELSGFAWGENMGWVNFGGGALASPPNPARLDFAAHRFRGYAWSENFGWINLDDDVHYVGTTPSCGSPDFNCDGDVGTDQDIEAFFACLAGSCPPAPCVSTADFNGDGDLGTDSDIESFFTVLSGGSC